MRRGHKNEDNACHNLPNDNIMLCDETVQLLFRSADVQSDWSDIVELGRQIIHLVLELRS